MNRFPKTRKLIKNLNQGLPEGDSIGITIKEFEKVLEGVPTVEIHISSSYTGSLAEYETTISWVMFRVPIENLNRLQLESFDKATVTDMAGIYFKFKTYEGDDTMIDLKSLLEDINKINEGDGTNEKS